jgi:hypothetical protein
MIKILGSSIKRKKFNKKGILLVKKMIIKNFFIINKYK